MKTNDDLMADAMSALRHALEALDNNRLNAAQWEANVARIMIRRLLASEGLSHWVK